MARDTGNPNPSIVIDKLGAADLNSDLQTRLFRLKVLKLAQEQWGRLSDETKIVLASKLNFDLQNGQDPLATLQQEIHDQSALAAEETTTTIRHLDEAVKAETVVVLLKGIATERNQTTHVDDDPYSLSRLYGALDALKNDARDRKTAAGDTLRTVKFLPLRRDITDAVEVGLEPNPMKRILQKALRLFQGKPVGNGPIVHKSQRAAARAGVEVDRLEQMFDTASLAEIQAAQAEIDIAEKDHEAGVNLTREIATASKRDVVVARLMLDASLEVAEALNVFVQSASFAGDTGLTQ